jgi:HIRAN domain-containing protein
MDQGRFRRISLQFIAAFACLFLSGSPQAAGPAQNRGEVRILVQSSPLAGIQFYAAKQWWAEMRVDDRLQLVREPDNRHDMNAIRVEWKGHKLGYVPKRENQIIAAEMDRGTRLGASISKLQRHRSPWQRLRMDIYVLSPESTD